MDSGNISIGVILDLIKAFDTGDHYILLDKLSNVVFEEHLGSGLKAIWKTGNYMYSTVIVYLQPCQLRMEYYMDPY